MPRELELTGREDIRQTLLKQFRIFYRIEGSDLAVFMFVDGRRDIEKLLNQRLTTPEIFGDNPLDETPIG